MDPKKLECWLSNYKHTNEPIIMIDSAGSGFRADFGTLVAIDDKTYEFHVRHIKNDITFSHIVISLEVMGNISDYAGLAQGIIKKLKYKGAFRVASVGREDFKIVDILNKEDLLDKLAQKRKKLIETESEAAAWKKAQKPDRVKKCDIFAKRLRGQIKELEMLIN